MNMPHQSQWCPSTPDFPIERGKHTMTVFFTLQYYLLAWGQEGSHDSSMGGVANAAI